MSSQVSLRSPRPILLAAATAVVVLVLGGYLLGAAPRAVAEEPAPDPSEATAHRIERARGGWVSSLMPLVKKGIERRPLSGAGWIWRDELPELSPNHEAMLLAVRYAEAVRNRPDLRIAARQDVVELLDDQRRRGHMLTEGGSTTYTRLWEASHALIWQVAQEDRATSALAADEVYRLALGWWRGHAALYGDRLRTADGRYYATGCRSQHRDEDTMDRWATMQLLLPVPEKQLYPELRRRMARPQWWQRPTRVGAWAVRQLVDAGDPLPSLVADVGDDDLPRLYNETIIRGGPETGIVEIFTPAFSSCVESPQWLVRFSTGYDGPVETWREVTGQEFRATWPAPTTSAVMRSAADEADRLGPDSRLPRLPSLPRAAGPTGTIR